MRILWLAVGWVGVGLGLIGVALPVMPTVPFLLISAWAFSRSSPELRARILNNPRYGPAVRAWTERGVVSLPAKIWSVSAMSFGVGLSLWLGLDPALVLAQAAVCACIGIYIVTRPSV